MAANSPFKNMPISNFGDAEALVDEQGHIFAIGGIDESYDHPAVWMLCTRQVDKKPIKFLKNIRRIYKEALEKHGRLWNIVWLGNSQHVRWLRWLGAKFGQVYTINGEQFQYFEFERS